MFRFSRKGRDSSVCIASLRDGRSADRIPVGARFSAPFQTGPQAHPDSYKMGTGCFRGLKRPGRGVDHPTPSSAEVKERVELYLYSHSGPSWSVLGWTLPLPLLLVFLGIRTKGSGLEILLTWTGGQYQYWHFIAHKSLQRRDSASLGGGVTNRRNLITEKRRQRPWCLSIQIWNFYITEIKPLDSDASSFKSFTLLLY